MKHRFLWGLLAAFLALTLTAAPALAADEGAGEGSSVVAFELGAEAGEASVTFDKSTGTILTGTVKEAYPKLTVVIPNEIDGVPVTRIADNAFQGAPIGRLALPEGLISIGADAFRECDGLLSFNITGTDKEAYALPSTLTSIGARAFCNSRLTVVKTLTLPEGLKTLGEEAFVGASFYKIEFPESLDRIERRTFANCIALGNFNNGQLQPLVIPGHIKTIGEEAFSGCGIVELHFEEGVETIGAGAFSSCNEFRNSLVIPDSVTAIGAGAFRDSGIRGMSEERTLTLGSGVQTIGDYAFSGFLFKGDLVIPDSVETIGANAFSKFGPQDINRETKFNFQGGALTIGNGVKSIGARAFKYCGFTKTLTLGSSLEEIGDQAFFECNFTGGLTLPGSLKKIGASAFQDCGLTGDLVIPDQVTEIGACAFGTRSDNNVFQNFTNGTLTLGKSVTAIGDRAFNSCKFTGSLILPEGLVTVGAAAFGGYCEYTGDLRIPDTVTDIGDGAFSSCKFTGRIIIGTKVETIGNGAFSGCDPGEDLVVFLPSDVPLTIGDSAFENTRLTGDLVIPERTVSIGAKAFCDCYRYDNPDTGRLILGNKAIPIGDYAFSGCGRLTGPLVLPSGLKEIGDGTFQSCGFTGQLVLPEGLEKIGAYAFDSCGGFTGELVIPESVTSIGDNAFNYCHELQQLTVLGKVRVISQYAFSLCEKIQTAVLSQGVQELQESAFSGCTSLHGISLPQGLTIIGPYAFEVCYGLQDLTLPESLTSIGENAFISCNQLKGLSYNIKERGISCTVKNGVLFNADQTALIYYPAASERTAYKVPNTVATISRYAFSDCVHLESTILPVGTVSIGERAFYDSAADAPDRSLLFTGTQEQWDAITKGKDCLSENVHVTCGYAVPENPGITLPDPENPAKAVTEIQDPGTGKIQSKIQIRDLDNLLEENAPVFTLSTLSGQGGRPASLAAGTYADGAVTVPGKLTGTTRIFFTEPETFRPLAKPLVIPLTG